MATQAEVAAAAAATGAAIAVESSVLDRLVAHLMRVLRIVFRLLPRSDRPDADTVRQGVTDVVNAVAVSQRLAAEAGAGYAGAALDAVGVAPRAASDVAGPAPDVEDLVREFEPLVRDYLLGALDLEGVLDQVEPVAEEKVREAAREGRSRALDSDTAPTVTGYRRVIHPELSEGGACGLCVAASQREYTRADLKPIHDRCKCTVAPITDDFDPGMRLNDEDLGRVYDAAGGTTDGHTLKQARFQVSDTGALEAVKERIKEGPLTPRSTKKTDQK